MIEPITNTGVVGWSYEYINPGNMYLPDAFVQDKVLAPDRQAFKALIVHVNDSMTVPGVAKIVEYAHGGLPIVFSGALPTYLASFNASGEVYMKKALQSIKSVSNVHFVPYQELSSVLFHLKLNPRTKVKADRIWYTYWRYDEARTATTYSSITTHKVSREVAGPAKAPWSSNQLASRTSTMLGRASSLRFPCTVSPRQAQPSSSSLQEIKQ